MDKKEAKALVLEVHRYLADHPETLYKEDLPSNLWDRIKYLHNICPLCEMFFNDSLVCPECPLETCKKGSHYRSWTSIKTKAERKEYARFIIEKVSAWEIST